MQNDQSKNEQEEIKSIVEEADFNRPDYVFLPNGNHVYRQQGYYLVCQSCELGHATYLGKDKVMVGEEDGQPIIKKRSEVGMV